MEGNPLVVWFLMQRGVEEKTARHLALAMLLVIYILFFAATFAFLEWRFVAFEKLGCAAYCNCTMRMGNMTYILP